MTSFTPSSAAGTPSSASTPHPSRRRDKPQVSCTLCRRRKLKCDRGQPCETCTRRGLSLSCTYVTNKVPEKLNRCALLRPPPSASVQDRLGQLEKLVMDTFNAAKPSDQTSSAVLEDPSQLSGRLGRISIENAEISYVEGAHWTAILDGIGELKDYFEDDIAGSTQEPNPQDSDGPELLFGGFKSVRKQDILADIPPRPVVDRLIAKCFNSMDIAPMVIHSPTFLLEYERFWERPLEAPVMWLGLLFSIICCGTLYQQYSPSESIQPLYLQPPSDPKRIVQNYREKIVQCLILGNYTRSIPYTIETLLVYLHVEFIRSNDTQLGCWILLGIVLRIALRMGYHREPSNFPRILPFQAEMRRRLWVVISQLDVVVSAQVGLPRMIKESQCDTASPRNLLDEDFNASMAYLPPARPDTFQTVTLYFTAKSRIVSIFGIICDLTTSTKPVPYVEFMRLDKMLDDAYQSIPQWLQTRAMSKSIMDDPEAIIRRFFVALLFHKSKCVLHRTYMLPARTDRRYNYSRKACMENALQILELQNVLDQETQVGGRLYQDRWKVSAVMKTDFLLATTILCVDLDQGQSSSGESLAEETETSQRVVSALNNSYLIWLRSSSSSREAQKAAEALRIVLGKAEMLSTRIPPGSPQQGAASQHIGTTASSSSPNTSLSNLNFRGSDATTTRNWPMEFPDMVMNDFDFESWDSGYQTRNLDDLLEITKSFPGD